MDGHVGFCHHFLYRVSYLPGISWWLSVGTLDPGTSWPAFHRLTLAGLTGAEDVIDGEIGGDEGWEDSDLDGTPSGQSITTACWLTLKEASLLLGTIAQTVPVLGEPTLAVSVPAALSVSCSRLLQFSTSA